MSINIGACRQLRELGKYTQAASSLETLLRANNHDLRVRVELAETLATQGYTKKAYDLLDDGLETTNLSEPNERKSVIRMKLQRCFYEVYVKCSFDTAISSATELYMISLKDAEEEGDWLDTVLTVSYYCRLLCIGRLLHKQIPFGLELLAVERLKPLFYSSMQRGKYRHALRSAMDYKRCVLSDGGCALLEELVAKPDIPPLVKADALMDLLPNLELHEDVSIYENALEEAGNIYESEGHAHGKLDISFREACRRIAKMPYEKEEDLPFDDYIAQYESMEYLVGEEAAIDMIFTALEKFAIFSTQLAILQKSREITIKGGGLLTSSLRDINILARWLSRAGHSAKIIENATSIWKELDHLDCYFLRGQLAQILSHAYSVVGDQQNAFEWGNECQELWEKCLPLDRSQGRTVALRAKLLKRGHYKGRDRDAIFTETRKQIDDDINNGFNASAIEKLEILILELVGSPSDPEAETAAKMMMAQVEQLVAQIPESDSTSKLVNLYQARISFLLAEARGRKGIEKEEEGLELTVKAVAMSLKVKNIFEAATTLQFAAILVFSIFGKQPAADVLQNCYDRCIVARDAFKEIGALYQEANAAYWIALVLFEGWARAWVGQETTLTALIECEKLFDKQRSEISILKGLEAIEMKQRIAENNHVRSLYTFATRVCVRENMSQELWGWVQKMKARSLSDLLGLGVLVPESLTSKINSDPAAREAFEKELNLTERIRNADLKDRLGLHAELDTLHSEMQAISIFQELIALREGRPVVLAEVQELLSSARETHPHLNLILVDWFVSNDEIYLSIIRGRQPLDAIQVIRTFHSMSEVVRWKAEYMDTAGGREQALEADNFDESPFRELDFLVRPLAQTSQEGDVFIFSVSEAMHSIPIHALWIRDEVPVIDINPVIYCANLTSFTQCWRRAHDRNPEHTTKTMIAVYEPIPGVPFQKKEQEAVYNSIRSLATAKKAACQTGQQVTKKSFCEAFESSAFIHFHGHGLFDPASITDQALLLNPPSSPVSVKDFFDLKLKSPHVTLIACDSASQSITAGDEPLGMVTAILCAGASSVIGTLWPIPSGSGRLFSEGFYEQIEKPLLGENGIDDSKELGERREGRQWINLALVAREAILEIKSRPKTRFPYYWASFVLYGAGVFSLGTDN